MEQAHAAQGLKLGGPSESPMAMFNDTCAGEERGFRRPK